MDTQEDIETKKAIQAGSSETDEGPYYHESWWESYKGSVKGKLGGAIIGALVGALVGAVAATAIVISAGVSIGIAVAIAGAFAATGMVYGSEEFSAVGKVTGAVAAAHETSETRMKAFENGKFAEIKNEIRDLKRAVNGKPTLAASPSQLPSSINDAQYKTQHYDDKHATGPIKPVFWKIALIGAVVGVAAGALLAFGGAAAPILASVGGAAASHLALPNVYAASMATMGLFGASFGINRDVFRQIFDKTDLLFKGLLARATGSTSKAPVQEVAPQLQVDLAVAAPAVSDREAPPRINTIVYDGMSDYSRSDTYHRDRVLASARHALLSMDHTKSIPH